MGDDRKRIKSRRVAARLRYKNSCLQGLPGFPLRVFVDLNWPGLEATGSHFASNLHGCEPQALANRARGPGPNLCQEVALCPILVLHLPRFTTPGPLHQPMPAAQVTSRLACLSTLTLPPRERRSCYRTKMSNACRLPLKETHGKRALKLGTQWALACLEPFKTYLD